jgi:hypothetical protein
LAGLQSAHARTPSPIRCSIGIVQLKVSSECRTDCALECKSREVITADFIQHYDLEWRCRCALLVEAAHVKSVRARAAVQDCVESALGSVEVENDGLIRGEEIEELRFAHPMRVHLGRNNVIRSTTLTTRTRSSGACCRSHQAAAIRYQQSREKEHWMHCDTETDC